MKRYFSGASVVLGMLAAALGGCGDEGAANEPQQTKSAITSRGFAAKGCAGAGIFDITSNNAINFVALDQSSFNNMNAQLFTIDQNNVQQLVTQNTMTNQIDQAMQSMFDQVSNFTSASQRAFQLASQQATAQNNAFSNSFVQSDDVATTTTTTNSARNAASRNFARNNASGFNNVVSSNNANQFANSANNLNAWNSANSAQNAAATQGASNLANSAANSGAATSAVNAANSNANTSAVNAGSAFDFVATPKAGLVGFGFGKGGFGFGDIANQATFSNTQFNNVNSNLFNSNRSAVANNQFANLFDNQLSNVFSNARANSFNNVNAANQASSRSNVHNDANSFDAFNTSNTIDNVAASSDNISTFNTATVANHLARNTTAAQSDLVNSSSLLASNNFANQAANSQAATSATSQQMAQRYAAFNNLSALNSNHLVLQVNATAASQSAIVRVFTGNNATNVAANQDFAQNFFGCGAGFGIAPKVGLGAVPIIAPAADGELGDNVAVKPEEATAEE